MCTIDLCSKSCGRGLSTRPSVYKHLTVAPEIARNDAADSSVAMMVIAIWTTCCLCLFALHDLCLVFARVIMTLRMNCSCIEYFLCSSIIHIIQCALRFVARAFIHLILPCHLEPTEPLFQTISILVPLALLRRSLWLNVQDAMVTLQYSHDITTAHCRT